MSNSAVSIVEWHEGLAPGHSRGDGGELYVAGVAAGTLARVYDTPLLALDYSVLDEAIARYRSVCDPLGVEISYAGKAMLLVGLARHLLLRGLHLDVCSLGELVTAERAGYAAERLTLHGCGKTKIELDAVAAGRVGRIVVDNLDELRALASLSSTSVMAVVLRINTGVEAHTHEMIRTAGNHTKFGMPRDAAGTAAALLAQAPHLRFAGLHAHIGSQIYDEAPLLANAAELASAAATFAAHGLVSRVLIAGGGFGVRMSPESAKVADIGQTIGAIVRVIEERAQQDRLAKPVVGIEPGRALIAEAGTSLYRVMAVKNQAGRPFVVVDGGMTDNPRPALYDAYHHPVLASRRGGPLRETVVCGRSCENDRIVTAPLPDDIAVGDVLALCTSGAYTYSMSSNYNRFVRPAVVAVDGTQHAPLARRETVDDVLRNDCDE